MTAVNKALDWITKMAFLNVLWLIFLIPGLGIFGIFPSTSAMFTVIHKWLKGETDIAVFKTFWRTYKKEFIKSNKLGYLLSAAGYILYLDFVFLTSASNEFTLYLTIPYVVITGIFVLTGLYVFPIFVHYEMKSWEVIKSAFFMMLLNPMQTVIMVIGGAGVGYILWYFQGLALFFSFSILALIIMMPAQRAFEKMQAKQRVSVQQSS
ncbi:YesL family protein [Sediminibacillus massiliensis]|uniref:YesL family protein n=1 Tax=Sediminibacillus massiliensis TaxID=1926277 RepID=UPI0009886A21|nr:YesL family protein [Sediminibacillus massiliensis]